MTRLVGEDAGASFHVEARVATSLLQDLESDDSRLEPGPIYVCSASHQDGRCSPEV